MKLPVIASQKGSYCGGFIEPGDHTGQRDCRVGEHELPVATYLEIYIAKRHHAQCRTLVRRRTDSRARFPSEQAMVARGDYLGNVERSLK